jgi:hypothetical protein
VIKNSRRGFASKNCIADRVLVERFRDLEQQAGIRIERLRDLYPTGIHDFVRAGIGRSEGRMGRRGMNEDIGSVEAGFI